MNYTLILKGDGGHIADMVLGIYKTDPWQRPVKGMEIEVRGRTYKVLSVSPVNPTDTQTATIYLEVPNPNYPYKRL